jgi:hypothetical protein
MGLREVLKTAKPWIMVEKQRRGEEKTLKNGGNGKNELITSNTSNLAGSATAPGFQALDHHSEKLVYKARIGDNYGVIRIEKNSIVCWITTAFNQPC